MGLPVAEFCRKVLADSGYAEWLKAPDNEERRENVNELLAKALSHDEMDDEADVPGFLQEVSLVSDVDNLDGKADAVTLMTLHAAKGLEFPVVFLTGMEEGLLPHANSSGTEDEVEEERRLCYVGMTRAEDELILTAAAQRAQYTGRGWGEGDDESWERRPSRFLHEIHSDALAEESREELAGFGAAEGFAVPLDRTWRPKRKRRPTESEPERDVTPPKEAHGLSVGDWVLHPAYGRGRILTLQESERMTLATISLAEGGKRVFALEYVDLEKL
jgi:DNA helicase-2/ATP-dependent DNA helicase PcrA